MSPSHIRAFPCDNASHEAIASWFLGPKAENHKFVRDGFEAIVNDLQRARKAYHPEDGVFITEDMQQSDAFVGSIDKLRGLLSKLSEYMAEHNIPFYSPRYNAHMLADVSMPGVLGYLLTMMYNPNNVAPEASPLTSLIEYEVGQDLSETLGYRRQSSGPKIDLDINAQPMAWGHITCGGSIANLESMWVARNLKFYPLSFKNAMALGAPFNYIASTFHVKLCTGEEKLFMNCSTWELLNLDPAVVLDLSGRLTTEYGMSTDYVQKVMTDYIIQTVGKDALEKQFGITIPTCYYVAATQHYSWPKGAALTGIGSQNLVEINVDNHARMDARHLDTLLEESLRKQQAVYAVVCIIGSTEHGAVDPIVEVIKLREKFQKRGLSFLIHADAAWGGYFTTLLRERQSPHKGTNRSEEPFDPFVPKMSLLPYTKTQLAHLKYADSITIDPHKSGYIPYPAGALCYRDERARFLVTWTSPYIDFQAEGVQTMGTYGVEGSKPGAAPVAAWLSHEVIGLHKGGYGALLGESLFTGVKFYCYWATMDMDDPDLIVIPFNMLPSEMKSGATLADVEAEKIFIRDRILKPSNRELVADHEAMHHVRGLGSDLMINAFACNFRLPDGTVNTNVTEANVLNSRIYEKLSVLTVDEKVADRDVWVMSTSLSQAKFGECLSNFKRRLGVEGDEDLFVLVNVSMSPFPTEANFIGRLAESFKQTAKSFIKSSSLPRNIIVPDYHTFVMQGTDKVHLVALPMFQMANFRQQVILAVDIPPEALAQYKAAQDANPTAVFSLSTSSEVALDDILRAGTFTATIDQDFPENRAFLSDPNQQHFLSGVQVSNIRIIKNRSLDSTLLESAYPPAMPFYLYGTTQQQHIDHILLCSPNAQFSGSQIKLELEPGSGIYEPGFGQELERGLIAVFDTVREAALQPFSKSHPPKFFLPGKKFPITIHRDSAKGPVAGLASTVVAKGTITLGSSVFVDAIHINDDLTHPTNSQHGNLTDEQVRALKDFIKGETTGPALAARLPANLTRVGGTLLLDRYSSTGVHNDNTRNIAQRSAWKASWDTAVGRK
ncbi:hypothetical protein PHLCEN_2v824 [Hermanssonia centrifuga]|uniref:PLP-dependent transferase n=1 Tax=Hermanssonia centrifuga TaxID=98765 RepID=A0A2R6S4X6_9APHY|nr:hypothetical protein PHLCEN_2v824 [Hermanssonia centrifuga]